MMIFIFVIFHFDHFCHFSFLVFILCLLCVLLCYRLLLVLIVNRIFVPTSMNNQLNINQQIDQNEKCPKSRLSGHVWWRYYMKCRQLDLLYKKMHIGSPQKTFNKCVFVTFCTLWPLCFGGKTTRWFSERSSVLEFSLLFPDIEYNI